jgi:hypothetical protein
MKRPVVWRPCNAGSPVKKVLIACAVIALLVWLVLLIRLLAPEL